MKCDEIMNLLTEHFLGRAQEEEQLQLMIRHIATCRNCMDQLGALLNILSGQDFGLSGLLSLKTLSCSEFAERLAEYAEMKEDQIRETHPEAWWHLKFCPTCKQSYLLTRSFFDLEDGVGFAQLVGDLVASSERGEEEPCTLGALWHDVRTGFRNLSTELKIVVRKGRAFFEQLPSCLGSLQAVPVPFSARAFRGEEVMEGKIYQFSLPDETKDRDIVLSVRLNSPEEIDFRVSLVDTKNDSPVYGATVSLFDAMSLFLENAMTDEKNKGVAEFGKLRPGSYKFRIEDAGTTWEIPISLS